MLQMKRAYDPPSSRDGYRVLIDRLWPRGVAKEELKLDDWLKDLAPSAELRRWFGHDPAKWSEFQKRYRAELATGSARGKLHDLAERALDEPVTLVYSAKDEEHNDAVVLKKLLDSEMKRSKKPSPGRHKVRH
jgi:uncharacterized protein YeaO (DUF488 family)